MSKTWNGAPRNADDYYITPERTVQEFFAAFIEAEFRNDSTAFAGMKILDPCTGGTIGERNMPYPHVLKGFYAADTTTIDIRDDSPAKYKGNFLKATLPDRYDMIVSNPPFLTAQAFIEKSLISVVTGGFVSYLLRLGFYGSQTRHLWWQTHMPKYTMVHSIRPSFTGKPNGKGKTDGAEYAHFVWQRGYTGPSQILVI